MPDSRLHRGAHPEDSKLFAPQVVPILCAAATDVVWLLDRGYAIASTIKLVGDRYALNVRQRLAVTRCVCTTADLQRRQAAERKVDNLANQILAIDGYNLLTTIESAIGGGVLIRGRDRCIRDMASLHGTWRRVEETLPALVMVGQSLEILGVSQVLWLLDSPVSNSGRLRQIIETVSRDHRWNWNVELEQNPDARLKVAAEIVVSADSIILNHCRFWTNLADYIVKTLCPDSRMIEIVPSTLSLETEISGSSRSESDFS